MPKIAELEMLLGCALLTRGGSDTREQFNDSVLFRGIASYAFMEHFSDAEAYSEKASRFQSNDRASIKDGTWKIWSSKWFEKLVLVNVIQDPYCLR